MAKIQRDDNREIRLEQLLKSFDERKELLSAFERSMSTLVTQLLLARDMPVHGVSSRRKQRESLARKVSKPGKNYYSLSEITDLVGVRVTTYFENEIDRIGDLIEAEFTVDQENSTDKRKYHEADRFGYSSLHYVVSVSEKRSGLVEYSRFGGLKAEIQIRSLLQHTWAEIEHDLGYKSRYTIPRPIKRRFYRLAGLLELADQEFLGIRTEIDKYGERVKELLAEESSLVQIDKNSFIVLVEAPKTLIPARDSEVCKVTNARLTQSDDYCETVANMLLWLGVDTARELESLINQFGGLVADFADAWITQRTYREFNCGVSVMYMCYMRLAEAGDAAAINQFAVRFGLGRHVDDFGTHLLDKASSIVNRKVQIETETMSGAP